MKRPKETALPLPQSTMAWRCRLPCPGSATDTCLRSPCRDAARSARRSSWNGHAGTRRVRRPDWAAASIELERRLRLKSASLN